MDISKQIEALLFWKAEPISIKRLALMLKVEEKEIISGLKKLDSDLQNRGLSLIWEKEEVVLGTAKEMSSIIESITKEEINRELGKAGLETLSIILYQGPMSRADIDYIRGVNSQFILRNLLIRGLIERVENQNDARVFLYKPTVSLLALLGVKSISQLPEYEKIRAEIENFKNIKQDPVQ